MNSPPTGDLNYECPRGSDVAGPRRIGRGAFARNHEDRGGGSEEAGLAESKRDFTPVNP